MDCFEDVGFLGSRFVQAVRRVAVVFVCVCVCVCVCVRACMTKARFSVDFMSFQMGLYSLLSKTGK